MLHPCVVSVLQMYKHGKFYIHNNPFESVILKIIVIDLFRNLKVRLLFRETNRALFIS